MVDMSATLIHHGHIRLINRAAEYGDVIIGLTSDKEIMEIKGYEPEISFQNRKEILISIKSVKDVVETPWLITDDVLDYYSIDLLVHGSDNSNMIAEERLLVFPRTDGISSTDLRQRALNSITTINNNKLMLTPGPGPVLYENVIGLRPVFGRGDDEYKIMERKVINWIKGVSGQDNIVMMQGSASFAIELALRSFVSGRVLLVNTGFYSNRLKELLPDNCSLVITNYDELLNIDGEFDWLLCAYTETSHAFKIDLQLIREKSDSLGAKLFADSTGSIGLENNHDICDLIAFSSCKGLFGLTGAAFVAYKDELNVIRNEGFYTNIETHINHKVTGPYHTVASLYNIIDIHDVLRRRVVNSKKAVIETYSKYITRKDNQPLLCTYLNGEVTSEDNNLVLYAPRSDLPGSVICHLGEVFNENLNITNRIDIK